MGETRTCPPLLCGSESPMCFKVLFPMTHNSTAEYHYNGYVSLLETLTVYVPYKFLSAEIDHASLSSIMVASIVGNTQQQGEEKRFNTVGLTTKII